ncbi:MAG: hypothetical protein NT169_14645 [Chloroflexi bacterium]|nr:hypothetical protein [Chloroflexota bacterium]
MTMRVGVIGPQDVVNAVLELAAEFPSLQLIPICYQREEETTSLAEQCQGRVDLIVFTGPVPYYIATYNLKLRIPLFYVRPVGANLLRALFDLTYHKDIDLRRVSIDTLSRKMVEETYAELNLPADQVFCKEYARPTVAGDLVPFHYSLWKEGKTSAALTCLRSACVELQALGVPAFWITPVKAAIRETLNLAVLEGKHLRSQAVQIVVGICSSDGLDELAQRTGAEYEMRRINLALHDLLNNFGEQTHTWVQELDGNDFVLFMTRGVLEQTTQFYQHWPLLDLVRERLSTTISLGIGLGQTAYEAGKNARSALSLARQKGGDCVFVVGQDDTALGPFGRGHALEAVMRTQDARLIAAAKRAHLGIATVSKLDSLTKTLGRETVTTAEIAQRFNMTPRSARRLLSLLDQHGLAEVVGEEQLPSAGRPRMVYRIRLSPESDEARLC